MLEVVLDPHDNAELLRSVPGAYLHPTLLLERTLDTGSYRSYWVRAVVHTPVDADFTQSHLIMSLLDKRLILAKITHTAEPLDPAVVDNVFGLARLRFREFFKDDE